MSEHGHSFHIDTSLSPELIGQVISRDVCGMRTEVWRQIINLQDEGIRQGLIKLGWTPPGQPVAPQVNNEIIRRAKAVVDHWCEFGPEHGFDESMHWLEKALAQPGEEG